MPRPCRHYAELLSGASQVHVTGGRTPLHLTHAVARAARELGYHVLCFEREPGQVRALVYRNPRAEYITGQSLAADPVAADDEMYDQLVSGLEQLASRAKS